MVLQHQTFAMFNGGSFVHVLESMESMTCSLQLELTPVYMYTPWFTKLTDNLGACYYTGPSLFRIPSSGLLQFPGFCLQMLPSRLVMTMNGRKQVGTDARLFSMTRCEKIDSLDGCRDD
jgi:hypothetical protein